MLDFRHNFSFADQQEQSTERMPNPFDAGDL